MINKVYKYCIIFSLLIVQCSLFDAFATVFMGGEITWQCVTNGNNPGRYRFIMKLYHDCSSPLSFPTVQILEVINYPTVGSPVFRIRMGRTSITDITPVCNAAGPGISCKTATLPDLGTVSEYIYTSDSLYPDGCTVNRSSTKTGVDICL